MADQKRKIKKATTVRSHPMHVPVSAKNPDGLTTRKQHRRRVYTSYTSDELKDIARKYSKKRLAYPTPNNLGYTDGNKYDELIAIWVDYFNKIFPPKPPFSTFDPDVIKALMAGESEFEIDPENDQAFGITQITPKTLKIIKDPEGEVVDFLFTGITQKKLLDPEVAIPMGVRWLFYKKAYAEKILKRPATPDEIILAYKGLLKSNTDFKRKALEKFQKDYEKLKKK